MVLSLIKELINLFFLLLIFGRLDTSIMFIFLILLFVKKCITVDKTASWFSIEKWIYRKSTFKTKN